MTLPDYRIKMSDTMTYQLFLRGKTVKTDKLLKPPDCTYPGSVKFIAFLLISAIEGLPPGVVYIDFRRTPIYGIIRNANGNSLQI